MKNRTLITAIALSFVSTSVLAASAKFAAVYSEDPIVSAKTGSTEATSPLE
jgi:hypothetical protein